MKSILASLSCALLLAACGGGAKKCTTSAECDLGQSCLQGECRGTIGTGGGDGQGGGTGQGGGAGQGGGTATGGGTGQGGGTATGGGTGGGTGQGGGGGLIEPDAGVDPTYDGGCGAPMPGNPTIRRLCAAPTTNECDGNTDSALSGGGVPGARLNGSSGNGFDDDCDGQVDEGCGCPGNGQTKDCYLVPATQVDPTSGLPVGWCASNAKGSLDCTGGELATWSGVCRGAQPPPISDTCSSGDFNCDGLDKNNATQGCNCANAVTCPTQPLTVAPYPNPSAIPVVDGSQWVDASEIANTSNWTWTVLGGDCDNVLPYPTFALYSQANSTASGARKGGRTPVRLDQSGMTAKYVPDSAAKLIAIRAAAYGNGVAGSRVYPAFGLSGDYIVQGEFTLNGTQYTCTQKVQVRAPGIRAELCWDTVGGQSSTQGNDIDLHFARLQGVNSCADHGWDDICDVGTGLQDCFYWSGSGCVSNSSSGPGWGYADSADSACQGWSSKRDPLGFQGCTNPRLDRDNVTCNRNESDPTANAFCGPENINLDNPANGDRFVVGVNHYANHGGTSNAKPHVNLYCNGERVLSVGYNPATGQTSFPLMDTPGADTSGDLWSVATITANVTGGNLSSCTVATVPSRNANATRDGPGNPGSAICVDNNYASRRFVDNGTGQGLSAGAQPTTAGQFCKH